jgi:hypothetical protein
MQVENDYDKEVYDGDIGFVEEVDSEAGDLTAGFDDRSVTYGFGELDHPQEPGVGISSGDHSRDDPALRHAATEPALHRHHQGQEACRAGGPEKGRSHRCPQCLGTAEVVKTGGMAGSRVRGRSTIGEAR